VSALEGNVRFFFAQLAEQLGARSQPRAARASRPRVKRAAPTPPPAPAVKPKARRSPSSSAAPSPAPPTPRGSPPSAHFHRDLKPANVPLAAEVLPLKAKPVRKPMRRVPSRLDLIRQAAAARAKGAR
jgi:hypothetical protein